MGEAHNLAKLAVNEPLDTVWMEEIPDTLYYIVNLELVALSV
jgi:hypothetical protein